MAVFWVQRSSEVGAKDPERIYIPQNRPSRLSIPTGALDLPTPDEPVRFDW